MFFDPANEFRVRKRIPAVDVRRRRFGADDEVWVVEKVSKYCLKFLIHERARVWGAEEKSVFGK